MKSSHIIELEAYLKGQSKLHQIDVERLVANLGKDAVVPVTSLTETKKLTRSLKTQVAGFIISIIIILIIDLYFHDIQIPIFFCKFIVGMLCGCVYVSLDKLKTVSKIEKRAVSVLAMVVHCEAIVPLILALEYPDIHSRMLARQALLRLLPGIKDANELKLGDAERLILYRYLRCKDDKFVSSILAFVRVTQDYRALPFLETLLRKLRPDNPMYDETYSCLLELKNLISMEYDRNTLLNPLIQENTDNKHLLIPSKVNINTIE